METAWLGNGFGALERRRIVIDHFAFEHWQMVIGNENSMLLLGPNLISHDSLVLVATVKRALFLRNRGARWMSIWSSSRFSRQDNPATREQGTDRPGQSTGKSRSRKKARWNRSSASHREGTFCKRDSRKRSIAMLSQSFRQTHHHRSPEDTGPASPKHATPRCHPHSPLRYQGIDVASRFGSRKACRRLAAQRFKAIEGVRFP